MNSFTKKLTSVCVLVILIFSGIFISSCKKPAGEGGNSGISGRIMQRDYSWAQGDYPAADEDVYIIYGDEIGYSDKVSTDYQGKFNFPYLRKGDYKIYVYSRHLVYHPYDSAVVKEVTITDKKQSIDLGDILKIK